MLQIVENRVQLLAKLGELDLPEKTHLASLVESLIVSLFSINFPFHTFS